jgi:hypothetical protein
MNKSRNQYHKSHWFNYAIVFLLGIILAILLFIIFFNNNPESRNETLQSQKGSESTVSSQQSSTEEAATNQLKDEYPYGVDVTNNQNMTFRPKGDNVGTLHSGISILITPMDGAYSVRLAHSYHDADTDINDSSVYKSQIKNTTTKKIFIRGYGSTPQRDISINTEISLNTQLSNSGEEFDNWQGAKFYLFYATDGTLSLAVPDIHVGKEGQYMEYQQQ